MVHGNPTWSYYYRKLISLLSANYRVIALDHMGCGYSDKPQKYPYILAQHIENLEFLLSYLQVESYSLVVHDWGGAIGLGCGGKNPQAVEKIVVINSGAFPSSRIPFRISLCRIPLFGEVLVRLFNGFAWPATFMAVEKKMEKDVAAAYLSPYNNWANRIAVHRFVKDIPMRKDHVSYGQLVEVEENLVHFVKRDTPFLLLWGGEDFCFNDTFYDEWSRRFPHAEKHYFQGGGHYLLEDRFSEIAPIIGKFFTQDE
ncbi:MAG: alpha/beta fold hydrolase [Deltaproteobacteria bacterium]|nr:alpha/beta fold hydrolase [Deltaproteobacteria bacterium]